MDITRDGDDDCTIPIDCESFRESLAKKMRELAVERCQGMLVDRIMGQEDLRDQGYTVS